MNFILFKTDEPIQANVYEDDSIEMVCYKLSVSLKCNINDIYLFSRQYRTYTATQLFDRLNASFKVIKKFHLKNFMENLNQPLPDLDKDEYTVSDLMDYPHVLMDIPIGQTMDASVNPYRVHSIEKYANKPSTPKFDSLLLDYMPFFEDTVYVCLKSDFNDQYGIYFDHDLDATRMKTQNKLMDDIFRLNAPVPEKGGITTIACKISPVHPIHVPLDTLFNLLHVSEDVQMIQYNTGDEETILYKLLSHQEDIKGNKIPVLKQQVVLKRDQSYKNSVTVFFDQVKYAFLENGSIILETTCKPSSIEEVDELLKSKKYILEQVGNFMYESGYKYPIFESIRYAELLQLNITLYFDVNLKKIHKNQCNPFFIDLEEGEKRYKRVSMFNENTLIQEICIKGYDHPEKTISSLSTIFKLSKPKAREIVENVNTQVSALLLKNKNKKFNVKEKTGFPTTVKVTSTQVVIFMEDIMSIHYLNPVQKNMASYVALLTTPTDFCSQVTETVNEVIYDYFSDSDSSDHEDFEINSEKDEVEKDDFDINSENDELEKSDDDFEINSMDSDMEGGAIERDPELIMRYPSFAIHRIKTLYKDIPKDYTRKCPRSRLPIALSQKESMNEKVEKWKNKFVDKGVTFVCPLYWDVENKVPLHKHEIVGKKMIGEDVESEVNFEKDGTVFQFQEEGTNGLGKYPYPSLMVQKNGTVNGPCCFIKKEQHRDTTEKHEAKQHIITDTTRLIPPGRVSYLPQPIRYFFNLPDNCELESGKSMLRYGVKEENNTFMECIEACTSIIYKREKSMEQLIRSGFDTYNNGNLQHFKTPEQFIKLMPTMDYTYLWEIVSDFFNANLVILRVPNNTNLEIICPSNHYSTRTFNPHKKTLIIIEHNSGFEPIIEHDVVKNYHNLLHSFTIIPLQKVVDIYKKCKPVNQRYITNIIAQTMYDKLKGHEVYQVVQRGKCIGFSVESVFIPCYPSAVLTLKKVDRPINTFEETYRVLQKFSTWVPCKPMFKAVDGKIYGILTETNYLVECIPEEDHETVLPVYHYRTLYEYMPLSDSVDEERISYAERSKTEKKLYSQCRRLLKELISKNKGLRKKIKEAVREKRVTEDMVKSILENHVQMDDTTCKDCIIIPKYNLVTGKPNRYFYNLANELNHYTRLSTFITQPQLRIPDLPFSVNDNEVLLMGFMVESYYQELMDPQRLPDYYSTYDNANPTVEYFLGLKIKKLGYVII